MIQLGEIGSLNPNDDHSSLVSVSNFEWEAFFLEHGYWTNLEDALLEYHDAFDRHRKNIHLDIELEVNFGQKNSPAF